mmetsp:Transcript_58445/g.137721  ORF Transcript_58445/g.137721 Transcript_58445/m.137721 type:complete len:285 (+) Transcript_58445:106-960(+)
MWAGLNRPITRSASDIVKPDATAATTKTLTLTPSGVAELPTRHVRAGVRETIVANGSPNTIVLDLKPTAATLTCHETQTISLVAVHLRPRAGGAHGSLMPADSGLPLRTRRPARAWVATRSLDASRATAALGTLRSDLASPTPVAFRSGLPSASTAPNFSLLAWLSHRALLTGNASGATVAAFPAVTLRTTTSGTALTAWLALSTTRTWRPRDALAVGGRGVNDHGCLLVNLLQNHLLDSPYPRQDITAFLRLVVKLVHDVQALRPHLLETSPARLPKVCCERQ